MFVLTIPRRLLQGLEGMTQDHQDHIQESQERPKRNENEGEKGDTALSHETRHLYNLLAPSHSPRDNTLEFITHNKLDPNCDLKM